MPLFALAPIALIGPNVALALFACGVLVLGTVLLWRPSEPPILVFIFLYQWVQASLPAFYGNLQGLSVDDLTDFGGPQAKAGWISLLALAVLAAAVRVAVGRQVSQSLERLRELVASYPLRSFGFLYAAAFIFAATCRLFAPVFSGLVQPLLALAEIKWAAFLLLTIATFAVPGRSRSIWLLAFLLELALSVGGFFADFSNAFFYTIIGLGASRVKFDVRAAVPLALAAAVMLVFGAAWSEVKTDYRRYLSGGTSEQIVTRPYLERMSELGRLVGGLDGPGLVSGGDKLVRRLAYTEFLGLVMERVPRLEPYADGQIWAEAITRPFQPRLLFPDKAEVNDTLLTSHYTGISTLAFMSSSISTGYLADAYIDFGPVFMFVAVAAFGVFLGLIYRWLMHQPSPRHLVGSVLAPVVLMPAHLLDASILKTLPAIIVVALAALAFVRFPLVPFLAAAGIGAPKAASGPRGRRV